ncbi:conserved hypothetical protein [Methanosalsum zhilinae DSM 4017]|uniref:Nucleic acid binding OB-fold tRNA/helicase-type n=1 Tax=Methanosalsum zhilinae (strain DSM 4017 / NBRC 107636 / OCM 62 / WeN5) TaxID=679901 RepID=F7XPP2_METZD|nr:DNA-binding protein [Methanosalsum zhilinae]AEH60312.1 conserved hypothetical protein [Methanosalsum zhilinae DSM 4017]
MSDREVAQRVFAKELNDSILSIESGSSDSNKNNARSPNYLVTPLGTKVNRLFAVGVITEVDNIGTDNDIWRARMVDPSGAFTIYAGQYQQEAAVFLSGIDTPVFVSVVGKARMYEPGDGSKFISIRPEAINRATEYMRDRWVIDTVELTTERMNIISDLILLDTDQIVGYFDENGISSDIAEGIRIALEKYNTGQDYLSEMRNMLLECLKSVEPTEAESPKDINEKIILRILNEMDQGRGVIYEKLMDTAKQHGLSEEQIDEATSSVLSKGKCYEPRIGILKPV